MIVIKDSLHSKHAATRVFCNSHHSSCAFNPHFSSARIRRRYQNFQANFSSDGRTRPAKNHRAIQSNIACEASIRALSAIHPVENDGKPQVVPHSTPALYGRFENQYAAHRSMQIRMRAQLPQAVERLKIT